MKQSKIEIFKEHMQGIGGVEGLKTFFCVIGHRMVGDRIVSIKKRKTGSQRVYLRTYTCDIHLANTMLAKKNGDYNFLLSSEALNNAEVIIDAGANIGLFSRICRTVNNNAKIIAIELEHDNYEMLRKNTSKLNVECLNQGLWNHTAKLKVMERETGAVGFVAEEVSDDSDKYDVDAISVPHILSKYNLDKINIFKIDIEGSEFYLFDESCDEWIDKVDMYIIELHDRIMNGSVERVVNVMSKHGFSHEIIGESYIFTKK